MKLHKWNDLARSRVGEEKLSRLRAPLKMVALLRGINVGGNRKVPMPALCSAATNAGLLGVTSYINSGNLVFATDNNEPDGVATLLERVIEEQFGFHVEVIVRAASQWASYAAGSPFPEAARDRPNLLHLGLSKLPCRKDAVATLAERALSGELVKVVGDAIWVDFAASVGQSKLTPALFDKAAGSTVTMRNWNTVVKLEELLAQQ